MDWENDELSLTVMGGRELKRTERNEDKRKDKYFNGSVTVMRQKRIN